MNSNEEAQRTWFTADLHLLHPKIVDICNRPVEVEEHDDWLIDRLNTYVNKKDRLFILGDVSMGSKDKTDKLLDRIHGEKSLILGNHDKNIKNSTRFKLIDKLYDFNFNSEDYPNVHIVLCHYPMTSWNRKVYGSMHLHGHTHNRLDNSVNGLSFDIGVDANEYRPLTLEEVLDKITKISMDKF